MNRNELVRHAALMAAVCCLAVSCSRTCQTCQSVEPTPEQSYCGNAYIEDANGDTTFDKIRKTLGDSIEPPKVLMLSGGGSFGAWGAGVLNGWSQRLDGGRPKFQLVTGSSTGAILGTWAFIGSQTDSSARCAYTNTRDRDVYEGSLLFSWLWLEPWRWRYDRLPWVSMKNLGPLRDLFRRYTPMEQVEEVGRISKEEHRVFLVGTVDLDLGTFCTWDMGRLAEQVLDASDSKEKQKAYDRYMEVVMASSSNPGVFNPTFIPPKLNGDMHVDGGVRHQLFLLPDVVQALDAGLLEWRQSQRLPVQAAPSSSPPGASGCNDPNDPNPKIYAILNLPTVVPRLCTRNNVYDIAQRSLTVLTIQSLLSDVHGAKQHWEAMPGNGKAADFCVSRIPPDRLTWKFADEFPECQMRALYDEAVAHAKGTHPWETSPPDGLPSPEPCGQEPVPAPDCSHPAADCGPGAIWPGGQSALER